MGAGRGQALAGDLVLEVLRRNQVGLDHHPIAGCDQIAERVPLRRSGAGGVEAEALEHGLHGGVDRV